METLREKYLYDNQFKALVDLMVSYIHKADFTPSEMRQAAMLASIIYEERNLHKMVFVEKDVEEALEIIHKRVDRK